MTKILEQPVDRFPLVWPANWPATPATQRLRAKFHTTVLKTYGGSSYRDKKALTMAAAVERLMRECDRLGAQGPVLSTNVALRLDGMPRSDQSMVIAEPGAALYFRHKHKPIVMACDKWDRVSDNIAAIAGHIEALRATDRYGVGRLEQALAGYQRLLSGRRAWFEVLGFTRPPVEWNRVAERHRELQVQWHPDKPAGDSAKLTEINEAYETAREEFGR